MVIRKDKDNQLLKNTTYSLLGKVFAMLLLVLLDIVAARMLSVENYAEWVFFFSVLTMLFYAGWMGINSSAKVFVSKCNLITERNNCIRASFFLRITASIFFSLLIVIIMPNLARYLGYPTKYPGLKGLLQMAAILVFFNSLTEYFKEVFIGLQKYKSLFVITVCEYAGYLLFSFVLLLQISETSSIALGYALSGVCIFILGFIILKYNVHFDYNNTDKNYKEYIIPIIKYALPIALISLGGLILVEMDTFMLGLLSSKIEVATYSIAKNFCSKATHVNYALTVGTMTSFSILTNDNISAKKAQFQKIKKINFKITIAIAFIMLMLSTISIKLLYGDGYIQAGLTMRLLLPYYALYSISNFYSSFLDFAGKAKFRSICYLSIIILNLGLNWLLIPLYGARGAAIATDISLLPYTILVRIVALKQFEKFDTSLGS